MRNDYEPPTAPVRWEPARPHTRFYGPDDFDGPDGAARTAGLRRLSRLTWRTTQLSAIAAVGFAVVFSHTGRSGTAGAAPGATAKPTAKSASASPSPSATHRKRHRRQVTASPTPTLSAPTTPPAPPPSPSPTPSPVQSTSGGSGGG